MSSAQSTIGIFAEVRLLGQNIDSDIAALRAKFEAGFQSMEIPIGERIVDSISGVGDRIRETIAAATAAGFEEGIATAASSMGGALAVMGGRAAFHESDLAYNSPMNASGYYQGMGMRQLPNYPSADSAWAGQEYPFEGQVMGAQGMLGGPALSGNAASSADAEPDVFQGGDTAGRLFQRDLAFNISLRGMMGGFIGMRLAKSGTEFAENMANDDADVFAAQNMPGRTDSQRVSRARAEVENFKKQENDLSGIWGGLQTLNSAAPWGSGDSWRDDAYTNTQDAQRELTNATANQNQYEIGETNRRLRERDSLGGLTGFARQQQEIDSRYADASQSTATDLNNRNASGKEIADAQQSLNDARDKEHETLNRQIAAYERMNTLEEQSTQAKISGNEVEVRHLELLEQISQKQEEMNQKVAGSGDKWAVSTGFDLLNAQDRQQSSSDFLITRESIQSAADIQLRASSNLLRSGGASAAASRDDFELKHQEERESAVNELDTLKAPGSKATQAQISAAELKLNAIDSSWGSEIAAFNNNIGRGTDDIVERTKELTLENSGNAYEAERQSIQYKANLAANAADDGTPDGAKRAAAIRGEEQAEIAHLHLGIRLESPMQAWLGMQHSPMLAHPAHSGTAAETNPHKPGTKAYREWETQQHIRETNAAPHSPISGPHPDAFLNMHAQNEATHKYLHDLTSGQEQGIHDHGPGYASAHRDSWAEQSKRQHDAAMGRVHDAQDKATQDRIHHAHEFDAGLLNHIGASPTQFGSHGEKLGAGAGPALGPGDPSPSGSLAQQTAQSMANAAKSMEKSAPHVIIMQPN